MDITTHQVALQPELLITRVEHRGARPRKPAPRQRPHERGRLGEDLAARHLVVDDGLEVVARNWRMAAGERRGELDLVAIDHRAGCVVVCEVKTRRDADRFGGALAAVSHRQRTRVRALAADFLRGGELPFARVRLDVVAVDLGRRPVLTHVPDAL